MKKLNGKTILIFVLTIAVIFVMYWFRDYVNSLLINFLLLIFAIKVHQIKSWHFWRYIVITNIAYFILYELMNMIHPIESQPLLFIWIFALIMIAISIGAFFIWRVKAREK